MSYDRVYNRYYYFTTIFLLLIIRKDYFPPKVSVRYSVRMVHTYVVNLTSLLLRKFMPQATRVSLTQTG